MLKHLAAAFATMAIISPALAQEAALARGKIKDATTGKPVPGATVFNKATGESAIADDDGNFEFLASEGPANLVVIDPSYKRTEARYDGTSAVTITLEPVSVRGEEIVVEAERERRTAGETTMKREEIARVPGSRGDALSAVKNLPGVANTSGFGEAGLVIRGSSPADSRIFVDGFEIPILYHLGGIQSVLPTEMIDDLVYTPGAFGVEYGRASAGTIQVTSRRGARELAGFAEVSFINAATMLQGPLGKKGSFAFAARRSYIDALIPLVVPDDDSLSFTALPRYYDYQGRVDYDVTKHLTLSAFILGSDDVFGITVEPDDPDEPSRFRSATRFTRVIASATYDRPGVYNKLAVSGQTVRESFDLGDDRYLRVDPDTLAARDDARVQIADKVALIAGGEAEYTQVGVRVKLPRPPREGDPREPDLTHDPLIDVDQTEASTRLAGWAAVEVTPIARLKTTAGVRVDDFRRNDVVVAQPRVQARLELDRSTSLLAAGGLYTRPADHQDEYLQRSLQPERAWQSSLGVENKLGKGITLTTTVYYNDRSDLITAARARSDAMSSDGSDTYTNDGTGHSYGAELLLQARTDKFFGWAAYTYARSVRKDGEMAEERLFDTDQTHNLVLLGSYKFGADDKWQIGGRFQLTSGTPYTPVTGAVFNSDINKYAAEYGGINSRRNPAQHQLDVRVDRAFQFKDWKLSGYLDVANVYLNAPTLGYDYNENFTKRTETKGLPILPSIGVRGEF